MLLITLVNLVLVVISVAKLLEAVRVVVSWGVRCAGSGCWQYWSAGLTAGRGQLGLTRFNTAAYTNTHQY